MITISKDEARILAAALGDVKYEYINDCFSSGSENWRNTLAVLEKLETKLSDKSIDGRRVGRTTQDSFNDLLKRYTKLKT